MKKYIFGLGKDALSSATMLAQMGYDGVILGGVDPAPYEAARQAGLETWLCYGAHSIGNFSQEEYGAVDANGDPAPWFSSSCPNAIAVNDYNLSKAIETAKRVNVKGIFVDGARFASFASPEGLFHFFGCFCERCMEKMEQYGIDSLNIRSSISDLISYLQGKQPFNDIPRLQTAIRSMLEFRRKCVASYMERFVELAHAEGFEAGAFVFTPSLWDFVGQSECVLTCLDVVAPMIYRDYPHELGPACLSHEWAGFKKLLSGTGCTPEQLATLLFGRRIPQENPMAGFSIDYVGTEVLMAKASLPKGVQLMPIIQAEDAQLKNTMKKVMESGADGCGVFCYQQLF